MLNSGLDFWKIRDVLPQMNNSQYFRAGDEKQNFIAWYFLKDFPKQYPEVVGLTVIVWCEI
jgi:hypothetical protein